MFDKLEKILNLFWLDGYRVFYDGTEEFIWVNTKKDTFKIMEYNKESLLEVVTDALRSSYNEEVDSSLKSDYSLSDYKDLRNLGTYIEEKIMLIDMRDELERM